MAGYLDPDEVGDDQAAGCLYTADIPDPDYASRADGERPIDNHLL
jgi:undecaprenyl pyrophosphate synthase